MTRPVLFAAAALSALLAGAPASADDSSLPWSDEVGQWFVMPFVGETFVDDDRLLDDDLHYGVAFGKHLNEDWSTQLNCTVGTSMPTVRPRRRHRGPHRSMARSTAARST
jgi:hypothetical protein